MPNRDSWATTSNSNYQDLYNTYIGLENTYVNGYVQGSLKENAPSDGNNVTDFFGEVREGYQDLQALTDILVSELQAGGAMTVDIRGYTSPRAPTRYNANLAKRRIASLVNYFRNTRGGVLAQYLRDGRLQVKELPLGETTSPSGISDSIPDERNSIYSPEASRERRVEIVAVRRSFM